MKYKVIYGLGETFHTVLAELEEMVGEYLKDGWEASGGISICCDSKGKFRVIQALVYKLKR